MAYTLENFGRFCSTLKLENGSPMDLEIFQREMLFEHFQGITETVIVIPKKNGKTTLLGALALFHLLEVEEAEVVIGAASRDQARVLFKQAAGLVRRSGMEGSKFEVKGGYGEIRPAHTGREGPRVRVLAADANTADGVIPTLALVDELHRHPSGDLYGIFRDGLGPRDGQMVTISTAGSQIDSPLGLLRTNAHDFPTFQRFHAQKRNCATSDNFVMHEWCLDPEEDVDDLELVALANPASWQTVSALKIRHDSPTTTPWQWRRFACGIWTEGEEPWIDPEMWDRLADPSLVIPDDAEVWLAVDIGVRHDSTAIAICQSLDGGRVAAQVVVIPPPPSGTLALGRVEREIRRLCGEYQVLGVVFDPWSFRRSAELLMDDGVPMVEFPQSPDRMASASESLYRLVNSGLLVHDGDPVLRAHVMAGVTKQTERGWRLVKDPKARRPIDGLIAVAMGCMNAEQVEVGFALTW